MFIKIHQYSLMNIWKTSTPPTHTPVSPFVQGTYICSFSNESMILIWFRIPKMAINCFSLEPSDWHFYLAWWKPSFVLTHSVLYMFFLKWEPLKYTSSSCLDINALCLFWFLCCLCCFSDILTDLGVRSGLRQIIVLVSMVIILYLQFYIRAKL